MKNLIFLLLAAASASAPAQDFGLKVCVSEVTLARGVTPADVHTMQVADTTGHYSTMLPVEGAVGCYNHPVADDFYNLRMDGFFGPLGERGAPPPEGSHVQICITENGGPAIDHPYNWFSNDAFLPFSLDFTGDCYDSPILTDYPKWHAGVVRY